MSQAQAQELERFVDRLKLRYFRGRELTWYWDRPGNFCPAESLWPNIVRTLVVLDQIRHTLGRPINITSSYRSPAYNRSVGGEPNSFHMRFKAIDFQCKGVTPSVVASTAKGIRGHSFQLPGNEGTFIFRGGIGTYATFVHVDTRGYDATW